MPPSTEDPPTEATLLAPSTQKSVGGTFDEPPPPTVSPSSSSYSGLTHEEAKKRLAEDGPNQLDPPERESFLGILLTQMRNMIFLLTLCAASLCYLIGDEVKSCVMVCIVCFVCLANTIGEYSAQDAADALAKMCAPSATVIRSGEAQKIPTTELVVGDHVTLQVGDVVPADMVLISSTDLQTNESALTGESHEVLKSADAKNDGKSPFPPNMVYSSTSVVSGKGLAEVTATGMLTEMGLIAKRLKHRDQTLDLNPLQHSINLLGSVIGCACITVAIFASVIAYSSGYQNPMNPCADDDDRCLLLSSTVRGLVLAVSIIPAGLPFIVMVMLRVGSFEMGKRNAVVTRQSTVDYLGATTVICTDKTGTLTEGKMTAEVINGLCRTDVTTESSLSFYPLRGTNPNGGLFATSGLSKEQKSCMDSKYNPKERRQTFADDSLRDHAAQADSEDTSEDALLARAHLICGFLNCYDTALNCDPSTGIWSTQGNMTEGALKVAAAKGGWSDGDGIGPEMLQVTCKRYSNLEVQFSSKRKMMATGHRVPDDHRVESLKFPDDAVAFMIVKGAPDLLIPKVSNLPSVSSESGSKCLHLPGVPLTDDERAILRSRNDDLSRRALRSILVAVRPLTQEQMDAMTAQTTDERLEVIVETPGLCFVSLWGISDPPRASVLGSVEECHTAGIRVVMITGDQTPTALAVGRQVHILDADDDPTTAARNCSDLHESFKPKLNKVATKRLSEEALKAVSEDVKTSSRDSIPDIPQAQTARNLIVHDERGDKDEHERSYKSSRQIAELTSEVSVWSRARPTDKVAIVSSLTAQGHITAMTGDGVNDAPALKHAMVGVSMGIAGTEVAKNASELILMDDDFSTIVAAIKEGRKIYSNVQKYVVFNLSIKGGECFSLLTAIATGVPMPIRGLQLLFNLVFTHIIPTMSLAWEEAESYVMHIPPRQTKRDLVVPPVMWMFRWLPFVSCMPCLVLSCLSLGVWMHTGFLKGNSIIGSSRIDAISSGNYACEYAGFLDLDNRFIDDSQPFHCRCMTHPSGTPWTPAVPVDQWGLPSVSDEHVDKHLDPWTGSTGELFEQANTPWMNGVENLLKPCQDHRGVLRWCWKEKGVPLGERPVLPLSSNCASYGAKLGQSMAYATIHLGEIMSLMTYRMDGFFAPKLFANSVFNGLFTLNICCLSLFLYCWPVAGILELAPLTASRFAIVICFDLTLVALNECFKVVYRAQLAKRNEKLSEAALVQARGQSPKSAV